MIAAMIAIIALLMLGGSAGTGWLADLEKPIKHAVPEKDRREIVLDAIDEYEDEMEAIGDSVEEHFVQLLELHIDFLSSEKDFDAVSQKLNDDQANAFAQDLKAREAMKSNLSPAEWNAVFAKDRK